MVNDEHKLLNGLLKECSNCVKSPGKKTFYELDFNGKKYTLYKGTFDGEVVWKIYEGEKELSRGEIIMLYAEKNLERQMKK